MSRYYVIVSDKLAQKLKEVEDERITEALEKVVDEVETRRENGGEELAPYDSVKEIRNDESKTEAERKRLELKWQRRIGHRERLSTER